MQKFIIAHGWDSRVDMIDALDLQAAKSEAARRSMADGLLDDDLSDTTWAEPYSDLLARDVGILDTQRTRAPYWA